MEIVQIVETMKTGHVTRDVNIGQCQPVSQGRTAPWRQSLLPTIATACKVVDIGKHLHLVRLTEKFTKTKLYRQFAICSSLTSIITNHCN